MDIGIISHRYAKAIYQFASERKEEDRLREELKVLSEQLLALPLLQKTLNDPTISAAVKIKLLSTATAGKDVSDICRKAFHLIIKNKRVNYLQSIVLMYDTVYRKEKNIVIMKLVTTEPASDNVKNKLVDLVGKDHDKVEFKTETNTDLIGGFVLEIEDLRLDASVKNLLNQLRQELIHS
jgi:F-type H+-transporting ATPase subunit delta